MIHKLIFKQSGIDGRQKDILDAGAVNEIHIGSVGCEFLTGVSGDDRLLKEQHVDTYVLADAPEHETISDSDSIVSDAVCIGTKARNFRRTRACSNARRFKSNDLADVTGIRLVIAVGTTNGGLK